MKQLFKLQQKIEKMRRQRDEARAELLKLRTIQATIEPSAEYAIKEMHIDCSAEPKKDFEVGKWYRTPHRFGFCLCSGDEYKNIGYWRGTWDVWKISDHWQLATPQEIEEVLTKRCKELGLFDGEFECLSGLAFYKHKRFVEYWEEDDKLWIGRNIAYEKGKFAKLVDKKTK